eukprot:scaffold9905_cov18-Tisochrysis_lutea.AAC.3
MRPGAQLEASQQQHSERCKQLQSAKNSTYPAHTLDQVKKLELDLQRSTKLAQKLHAWAFCAMCAQVFVNQFAIKNKNAHHNPGARGCMLPESEIHINSLQVRSYYYLCNDIRLSQIQSSTTNYLTGLDFGLDWAVQL